jgi:hypothetical protein
MVQNFIYCVKKIQIKSRKYFIKFFRFSKYFYTRVETFFIIFGPFLTLVKWTNLIYRFKKSGVDFFCWNSSLDGQSFYYSSTGNRPSKILVFIREL